jgi:dihydropteroate synthase
VPRLMGIVNVTPDSFSDGGLFLDPDRAIAHGHELAAAGADILDVGGESTRPSAEPVNAAEELRRVGPVVEALAGAYGPGLPVSIDTAKASVAAAALDAGAQIVNDVTALRGDPELGPLCAERGATVVVMHMLGTPRTMQEDPRYEDVVEDVKAFLAERMAAAIRAGIDEQRVWVDPGIGFGKTVAHNLELLRRLGDLHDLGRPIVVGASRKSFIGRLTGREITDRIGGTIAANAIALARGADVLRVHDVAQMRDAAVAAQAILGGRDWRRDATVAARSSPPWRGRMRNRVRSARGSERGR